MGSSRQRAGSLDAGAVAAVRGSSHLAGLDLVRFVLFSPATREAFITALG